MEFGDEVGQLLVLDIQIGVVFCESLGAVDRPLASYVIGYDNLLSVNPFQHRCNNVIRVNESGP